VRRAWGAAQVVIVRVVGPPSISNRRSKSADMEAALPVPNPEPSAETEGESRRGCLPALVRLIWIFGGILLVYGALFIAQRKGGLVADLGLFGLALLIILVRFVDIKYLKGETMDNKPATLRHWRRYALLVLIAAGFLFALGKFLAQKNIF
jgi:hypothetical protein